ncbi:uncharacterized protein LOC142554758 [Primulina tabacum]|uniref:uncharacterized protein LOC142554758 n=1 Tax=Primulina tabacum TaxID=48773 RepID=UPI003F5971DA
MRAMASTYHQKIKFPVRGQVGEVRGDQPSSRKCYVETVRVDQKRARKEDKGKKVSRVDEVAEKREMHFVAEEEQEVVKIEPGKHIRQELVGISPQVAEHKLNIIPGSRPVKQKKRYFGPEKDKVIDEQVQELLRVGHIREGYHKIPLAWEDQDKASFITSGDTFCYVVMPFGLKNAGATYQHLMNHVFQKQMGRNVEVYVDDILIKTRSAHRSYPFFQVLRKAQMFSWDEKGEQDFQDLKKHLTELPILVKPEPGERLWVYLSATEYAVSSVLIRKEGTDQKPMYYVSHVLRGAELKYSEVEKIALALVVTARKLRPYFLSHPIVVLTNYPLGRIMTHSEVSGRMVKWTVELRNMTYDIKYKPRDVGSGVVLIAPSVEKLALRIDYRVTNNDAEYEAVLVGLQAAREVGASWVIIYSDSQLVAQQIKGVYEAKDEKMLKYLGLITARAARLIDWSIEQIPWEKNGEANTLAKMAASLTDINSREILCFTRLVLSIDENAPST